MEITPEVLYWLSFLGDVKKVCIVVTSVGVILLASDVLVRILVPLLGGSKRSKKLKSILCVVQVVTILGTMGIMCIPSSKKLVAIYILPTITNSDETQSKTSDQVSTLLKECWEINVRKKEVKDE